jgi:hypothetical protein
MAKLKVDDKVKLNLKQFGEYERSEAIVSEIYRNEYGTQFYRLEGIKGEFIQGGSDWQQSNEWRDRFYYYPTEAGGPYFTRT